MSNVLASTPSRVGGGTTGSTASTTLPAERPTSGIDLAPIRADLARLGRPPTTLDVAEALRSRGHVVTDTGLLTLVEELRRHSIGAGPLEDLLGLPGVTDVLVNGPDLVFVDRGGGLELTTVRFADETELRTFAQRLAAAAGRRLDTAMPYVDARLADGTRVHAVLGTVAWPGTCVSLRVPAHTRLTLDDWVARGSMDVTGARLLEQVVRSRLAFLVTGGTGSGKTTLLATLLGLVPVDQRLVVVEDSRELDPDHPHVVRLEGRPVNAEGQGGISLTVLVRQALRMRPDRLVVGEVRGAELGDLLTAMNTGHEGGCGTIHANSPADVPARLEALAALGGWSRAAVHAQVAAALHAVVHLRRDQGGRRRLTAVHVLVRDDDTGLVSAQAALSFAPGGAVTRGPGCDRLEGLLEAGG